MSSNEDIKNTNTKLSVKANPNCKRIETDVYRLEKVCKFGSRCTKINDPRFPCQFNHFIKDEWCSYDNLRNQKNFCCNECPSSDKSREQRCKDLTCKMDHLANRCYWAKTKFSKISKNGFSKKIKIKEISKDKSKKKKVNNYDYKTILSNSLKYLLSNSVTGNISDNEKDRIYIIMNILAVFLNENNISVNDEISYKDLSNFLISNIKGVNKSKELNDIYFKSFFLSNKKKNNDNDKVSKIISSVRL